MTITEVLDLQAFGCSLPMHASKELVLPVDGLEGRVFLAAVLDRLEPEHPLCRQFRSVAVRSDRELCIVIAWRRPSWRNWQPASHGAVLDLTEKWGQCLRRGLQK